ncbi:MAG: hypothetical protein HY709_06100 [Candidatus Latescibacteria bacterium]|nr:hypothetical protein [Candidatus Latescibacterota bacterium]
MPEVSAIRSPAVEDLLTPPVADPRLTRVTENQHIREEDAFRQRIEAILDTGLRQGTEVPERSPAETAEEARSAAPTPTERQRAARGTEAALEAEPLERPFEGRGAFERGGGRGLLSEVVDQINGRFEQFEIPIGFDAGSRPNGNGTSFLLRDLSSEEEITRVNTNRLLAIQRQIEDALSIPGTSELPPGLFVNRLFV